MRQTKSPSYSDTARHSMVLNRPLRQPKDKAWRTVLRSAQHILLAMLTCGNFHGIVQTEMARIAGPHIKTFFFAVALRPNADHGRLILEVSRLHTTTHHSRQDSSGRVISLSQRPLPDNTQHLQPTNIHAPVGFEPTISAGERQQTYALDRAATYMLYTQGEHKVFP